MNFTRNAVLALLIIGILQGTISMETAKGETSNILYVSKMPARWSAAFRAVLLDFESAGLSSECYVVIASENNHILKVSFSAGTVIAEDGESVRGNSSRCGPSVEYKVDYQGKFTKIYMR